MSFARKARRGAKFPRYSPGPASRYKPAPSSQFQINPVAYLEAVAAGLCPYDGSPLTAEQADPTAPINLSWCPKCERGFGPVESGDVGSA